MYAILYKLAAQGVSHVHLSQRCDPAAQARVNLSELADQVKAGAEKIVTKNDESYVAIIDAQRMDYYHQLERERIHLLLIADASNGLADMAASKVKEARSTLSGLKLRRAARTAG
jgi:antitoxin (DNA-binding transcriptional repressor) of toxin-antitoxin stability system